MPPALPTDDPVLDARFEGLDLRDANAVAGREFEGCTFVDCDVGEGSLVGTSLLDCAFERCDLRMVDVTDAHVRGVMFDACGLQGVDFGTLADDPLGVEMRFDGCDLAYASFVDLDLRRCDFEDANLVGAIFERCDLRGVRLAAKLRDARFTKTDLREADLRGASGYRLDPHDNRLTGMRVSLPEALALFADFGVRLEG